MVEIKVLNFHEGLICKETVLLHRWVVETNVWFCQQN